MKDRHGSQQEEWVDGTSGEEQSKTVSGVDPVETTRTPEGGDQQGDESGAAVRNSPPDPDWRGYAAGALASGVVTALTAIVMVSWSGGASGDVLLFLAVVGLLFVLPHTIPVWSGLTLLGCTAAALIVGTQSMAETFADLAYYGISVGCLWGIWNEVASHFKWRMPLRLAVGRLTRPALPASSQGERKSESMVPSSAAASVGAHNE